jgi:NADH-quinone oxidoreductase subunit E
MPATNEIQFPQELIEAIHELITHYPEKAAALIPALHLIQERFGYISNDAMEQLSAVIEVPPAEILGTLTFYTMFRREPSGRFHVNVCQNLSCNLMGSGDILSCLENKLGIKAGETTDDGLFTLGTVECLGACNEAPVMEIDCEYFMRLTPEKVDEILDDYRSRAGS